MDGHVVRKVLIAVHGDEVPGWADELLRALPSLSDAMVRVVVVLDAPAPSFTSLGGPARRRYRAALAEQRQLGEARTGRSLDELLAVLPEGAQVVRVAAAQADPGRTIAAHAEEWGADLVGLGAHSPGLVPSLLLGAVHERVMRYTSRPVLVAPSRAVAPAARPQGVGLPLAAVRPWPPTVAGEVGR